MANLETTEEDTTAIREILLGWKAEGNENPLLPADVDIDGDGIVDSFGLDENDNVIVVPGVKLEETVYVSDGDDVRDGNPDE